MLHYIKGTLAMKLESSVVVEAGGLGYQRQRGGSEGGPGDFIRYAAE